MGRRSISRDPLGLCGVGYDQKIMNSVNRDWTYWNYLRYLYVLAISRFKWNGLPDTVSERVIEQTLIMKGNCLFFENPVIGMVTLPSANTGKFNIYNIPRIRHVNTANGYHTVRYENNSVLVFNDATYSPFVPIIEYYAQKLARVELAKDVNITLQMRPKIIRTNKDNENSMRQMINNTQLGLPYIFYDDSDEFISETDKPEVLDLSTPIITEPLDKTKMTILGEYLSLLGYNNISVYKAEHLTVDEGNANNEHIMGFRNNALRSREIGAEQVNRMFGTNISVEFDANALSKVDGTLQPSDTSDREGYGSGETEEKEGDE